MCEYVVVLQQNETGNLSSQLNEAQNEVSRLRAKLHRVETELETERSRLLESVAGTDREKVHCCAYVLAAVCFSSLGGWYDSSLAV